MKRSYISGDDSVSARSSEEQMKKFDEVSEESSQPQAGGLAARDRKRGIHVAGTIPASLGARIRTLL